MVHVLQNTQNLVISRCCFEDDGTEMYKSLKRTGRAIVQIIKQQQQQQGLFELQYYQQGLNNK